MVDAYLAASGPSQSSCSELLARYAPGQSLRLQTLLTRLARGPFHGLRPSTGRRIPVILAFYQQMAEAAELPVRAAPPRAVMSPRRDGDRAGALPCLGWFSLR